MLSDWLKGLYLLRHPEVTRFLGEHRFKLQQIEVLRCRYPTLRLDSAVEMIAFSPERLSLGTGVTIRQGSILAFGDEGNGFGQIVIGDDTWIGQYNNLRACGNGDIVIGSNSLISQFCTLVGSNHNFRRGELINKQGPDCSRLGVTLADDVWLGASVTIMPGVQVGEGAIIGANAAVTQSVPAYEIWGGVPARKIGERQ